MTSATLFREGNDLDALLAELDAEHPGLVQVVEVEYGRDGGVLGFFAHRRVAVHYRLTDEPVAAAPAGPAQPAHRAASVAPSAGAALSLEELLAAADADDSGHGRTKRPAVEPASPAAGLADDGEPDETQVEFARMLLDIATAKAAERHATVPANPPAFPTVPANPPAFPTVPANPPAFPTVPANPPAFVAPPVAAPAFVAPAFVAPTVAAPAFAAPAFVARPAAAPLPVARMAAPTGFVPPEFALGELPAALPTTHPTTAPTVTSAPSMAPTIVASQPAAAVPAAPPSLPSRLPRPAGAHRAHGESDSSWGEYALRRRLVDVGVPVEWIPDGADNLYWVVEQLSRSVPSCPQLGADRGHVVVVAGPAGSVLAAARELAVRLCVDPQDVFTAGCPDAPEEHRLEPWTATSTAVRHRTLGTAAMIVAVALDGSTAEDAEAGRQVVRALAPTRVHLVVDAGRKSADVHRTIASLPAVHSLFVINATRTASPASVWELGVPIEMLDGRRATQGRWAAVLIDALAALDVA